MSKDDPISRALDGDIVMAHERFVEAMEARLPTLELASKERYFAVLTILIGKLETAEKSMQEVLVEMMAEAGRHLMEEMSARR
ncbi:MAG: hypothetical protein SF182_17140 [Deltaproteobacteria bacterium]|nr:hypothetical protein [Deltaproteobacteria bacterium]